MGSYRMVRESGAVAVIVTLLVSVTLLDAIGHSVI